VGGQGNVSLRGNLFLGRKGKLGGRAERSSGSKTALTPGKRSTIPEKGLESVLEGNPLAK